jgi:hypothetical protein
MGQHNCFYICVQGARPCWPSGAWESLNVWADWGINTATFKGNFELSCMDLCFGEEEIIWGVTVHGHIASEWPGDSSLEHRPLVSSQVGFFSTCCHQRWADRRQFPMLHWRTDTFLLLSRRLACSAVSTEDSWMLLAWQREMWFYGNWTECCDKISTRSYPMRDDNFILKEVELHSEEGERF